MKGPWTALYYQGCPEISLKGSILADRVSKGVHYSVQLSLDKLFNLSTPFMRKVVDGGKKKNKIRRAIETKFYKLSKQAGAELGQAQLKLQLGFTSIKIDQLN